jgi:hypothetical protein
MLHLSAISVEITLWKVVQQGRRQETLGANGDNAAAMNIGAGNHPGGPKDFQPLIESVSRAACRRDLALWTVLKNDRDRGGVVVIVSGQQWSINEPL